MSTTSLLRALAALSVTLAAISTGQLPAHPAWTAPGRAEQAGSTPTAGSRVIVEKTDFADQRAERAVTALGGHITRALPIVNGFAATLPSPAAARELATTEGVVAVTPDRTVHVQADVATMTAASGTAAGPASVFRKTVNAHRMRTDGSGVTVALIDTGVAAVPDLEGRMVPVHHGTLGGTARCLDLSGQGTCDDAYGHGTFMAGLIAGTGASSGGGHTGVAPGARILSVKIAGRDGAADVSTVLAAIQWVVAHADTYGIDILNLSLGTDSTRSYRRDPLNFAVEKAWDAGVAVIVAASNRGPAKGTVGKPGDDPLVITVGATDDRGTKKLGDDLLPDFSARGPTAADGLTKPDLVAPGARVTSLRAPGSLIDEMAPGDGAYLRGSGTSMATAVVSGVAALALQAEPGMSPDRLKYALKATAREAASTNPQAVGAGVPTATAVPGAPAGRANRNVQRASDVDLSPVSLDASRGSVVVRPVDTAQRGVETAVKALWGPMSLAGRWGTRAWGETAVQVSNLTPMTWSETDWRGKNWQGATFYGRHLRTPAYGQPVRGSLWYGAFG